MYGRNLAIEGATKIISWYENQTFDKNLYSGLRDINNKVYIYGCQLYIYPPSIYSMRVMSDDLEFGIVPDKILVNGKHYLYENCKINSIVGPSFRYSNLFDNIDIKSMNSNNILVLLPYFDEDIVNILRIVRGVQCKNGEVYIKFHPAILPNKYKCMIPDDMNVVTNNLYDLFKTTKVVIGAATGSMVEAACFAIPTIVIKNDYDILCNYFGSEGKGVIWEYAQTHENVLTLLQNYDAKLSQSSEREIMIKYSTYYKDNYFTEPTRDMIVNSFDLSD